MRDVTQISPSTSSILRTSSLVFGQVLLTRSFDLFLLNARSLRHARRSPNMRINNTNEPDTIDSVSCMISDHSLLQARTPVAVAHKTNKTAYRIAIGQTAKLTVREWRAIRKRNLGLVKDMRFSFGSEAPKRSKRMTITKSIAYSKQERAVKLHRRGR